MRYHGERKHSKFSASGAERWMKCPGSVALSEGLPDQDSVWSLEGTRAHEVLENMMIWLLNNSGPRVLVIPTGDQTEEMIDHAIDASNFIVGLYRENPSSDILVETRIHLDFIHPEMFGTFDGAVLDHFDTLHVFDYKYGAGHSVSPTKNLQMIFYGLGLAHEYDWNFKRVRLWIIQPRIKGYDGPTYWDISIGELKDYIPVFTSAVKRVEKNPTEYVEGSHCHWCKAKKVCPLKQTKRFDKAVQLFKSNPVGTQKINDLPLKGEVYAKEESFKSEADSSQKSKSRKKEYKKESRGQEKSKKEDGQKEKGQAQARGGGDYDFY